jgi:hypothetical protein
MVATIKLFFIFISYFLLIGTIFLSVVAKDEGTLGNSILLNLVADYLNFIAYPAFIFAWFLSDYLNNIQYITIAVFANAVIYTIITHILIKLYQKKYKRVAGTKSN